jgi:tryptophanyl-tRNA synthetase
VRSLIDNPTTKAEAEQHGFSMDDGQADEGVWNSSTEINSLISILESEFKELGSIGGAETANAIRAVLKMHSQPDPASIQVNTDQFTNNIHNLRLLREEIIRVRRERGFTSMTYGFLGYPVSQAADITFIGAHLVPVGPDQVPLIELCREVVHRFNSQYGSKSSSGGSPAAGQEGDKTVAPTGESFLTTPFALLGVREALPGLDGNLKMGKSLGNAINLSETDDEIWAKVRVAPTDPQRIRRTDPGRPEVCNIFSYHKVFNGDKEEGIDEAALGVPSVAETAELCRTAGIGCVDCKKNLCRKLTAILDPMRERRAQWAARPDDLMDVLKAGTARANEEGEKTLARVKSAMHMDYFR